MLEDAPDTTTAASGEKAGSSRCRELRMPSARAMVGDEAAVPVEAVFLDALLRLVVHVGQAEALAVAEGLLEVVHQ